MNVEPAIDHKALLTFLQRDYNIPAEALRFVPMGMVSCSYIVEGASSRWFLKLLGESRLARQARERLSFFLPVCERLSALGHPVPTVLRAGDGTLTGRFGEYETVLAPYLPGTVVMDLPAPPPDLRYHLGSAVGRLHRDTPRLGLDPATCPYVERWDPHWKPVLLGALAEAAQTPQARLRAGQRRLRALLQAEEGRIFQLLERMEDLGRRARERNPRRVLVHTDLNDSNLILSEDGTLWLLDWEGAMLGPAENDLFIFTGEGFEDFLRGYVGEMGAAHLSAESFGYNFYRRSLEDLTDWVVTILRENTTDDQDQADLEGIRKDCLDGWPGLEASIEAIRGAGILPAE